MTIKELSEKTGISRDTIRFYEKNGLLPPPKRNKSGYRDYGEEAVFQLSLIARAKSLGFTLNEITELNKLLSAKGLTRKKIAQQLEVKLEEIDLKILALKNIKNEIKNALKGLCEYKDHFK